jgi:hypothetical protein
MNLSFNQLFLAFIDLKSNYLTSSLCYVTDLTDMGPKGKKLSTDKAKGASVPTVCSSCTKPLYMSLTLATEHIKECKRKKELEARARRKAQAPRVQEG